MKYLATILIAISPFYFAGCGKEPATVGNPPRTTISVFAAASLTESFTEIGKRFESANPDACVEFNFAGSQQLRAQIESGAQADVFASANEKEMDTAKGESLVKAETVHDFARNRLIVIYPKNNPAKIGPERSGESGNQNRCRGRFGAGWKIYAANGGSIGG